MNNGSDDWTNFNYYKLSKLPRGIKKVVYLLMNGTELIYIGRTKSLWERLRTHKSKKIFDGLFFFNTNKRWKEERKYIKLYCPKYNRK